MKKSKYSNEEKEKILTDFMNKLNDQKDIPEDMRLTNEEYWKLLY